MHFHHLHVQMRRLGPREVKPLAQVCTANKWQTQDFSMEFGCTCNILSIICYLCRHKVTSEGPFLIYF